jgi:hypothetical protein
MRNSKIGGNLKHHKPTMTASSPSPALPSRFLASAGALLGWSAVVLQFYLILTNRKAPVAETIIRFFSFFTILTNILAATSFTLLATARQREQFLTRPPQLSAITVYIFVVGLVYNVVLRFIWNPAGLQRLVDELLHVVIPLLFLIYWLLFVDKKALKWTDAFVWLLYPLVYLGFVLTRGATSGFYPYPFIDVVQLGSGTVFRNCVLLFIVFLVLSLLLIGGARLMKRTS